MNPKLHIITVVLFIIATVLLGIIGYSLIENWSFLDSLYMTVETISSVGFGEVQPLSAAGKIFTIFIIILGVGIVIYGLRTIAAMLIEGKIRDLIRREKMERQINALKDHVIICGLKETAKVIVDEFRKTKTPFIVVSKGVKEWVELTGAKDIFYIDNNPLDENVLEKARIRNARGLIVALKDDSKNVFVVLTARQINPNLRIVSEVQERSSGDKFIRAGADSIVCPENIGGQRLASEIIRPTVVDFLEIMMKTKEATFRIEEVELKKDSSIANKTLAQADLGKNTGVIVIAIKNITTAKYKYNPTGHNIIKPGDILIVLGSSEQLESLRNLCTG